MEKNKNIKKTKSRFYLKPGFVLSGKQIPYYKVFVLESGNTTDGLNVFASSKSIRA